MEIIVRSSRAGELHLNTALGEPCATSILASSEYERRRKVKEK